MINKKGKISLDKSFVTIVLGIVLLYLIFYFVDKYYFAISSDAYILFHTAIELLTVIIGIVIFFYANTAYKLTKSNTTRIIGWAFLAMATIDLFHTVAYPGVSNPFFEASTNNAILFWLSARFIGAFLLFISSLSTIYEDKFTEKVVLNLKYFVIFYVVISITAILFNSFYNILPLMFIAGKGLTPLKIASEWLIMALFALTALIYGKILAKNRNLILLFFSLGLIITVYSEFAFIFYKTAFDVFNIMGHIFKIIAYLMFIAGVIRSML